MPNAGEPNQAMNLPPPRQRPWDEIVAVPLPTDAGFTDAEHWAWSQIIRGETADMRFAKGQDDGAGEDANEEIEDEDGAKTLKPWPESRKLSARFFEAILFHEPWASAKAKPWVRIRCAWVTEELDWANAAVNDELWLRQTRVDVEPIWRGARFAGHVNLSGTRFVSGLYADRLMVEAGLFCGDGFQALGPVRLLGARIGGNAAFRGATLWSELVADHLQVEGNLFCVGFRANGEVRLLGAQIGGDLIFQDATLMRELSADRLEVRGSMFCREQFKAEHTLSLTQVRIGRDAQLRGEFQGLVNLTAATITGELQFDQGGELPPVWGERARLVLRNATCGALAGAIASFRRANPRGKRTLSVPIDLRGFTYARIGGLADYYYSRAGVSLADAPAKELIAFLQSGASKKGVFTPQPYRQLADALTAEGQEQMARAVRLALLEHERAAKGVPFARKLARHLIGDGYENWRAAFGFTLVVLATAFIGLAYEGRPLATSQAAVDWRAMGDWGGYALGNAIPLLELDPSHRSFIADRFGETAPLGLKTWLYSFKLLGFLLLSYLAAGLSGFASRSARS